MSIMNKTKVAVFSVIMVVVLCAVLVRIAHHPALVEDSSSSVQYKTIVVKTDEGEKTYEHIDAATISEPNALNGSLRFTDKNGTEYHLDVSDYTIKAE